jgi:hypothetical protein
MAYQTNGVTNPKTYRTATISGLPVFINADCDGDLILSRSPDGFGRYSHPYVLTPKAQATLRKALRRARRIRRERGEA